MTDDDDEFRKWLFPPVLSFKRKVVINLIMLTVTMVLAWLCNSPESPFFMGQFQ